MTGYPAWLYSVDQGATTIWERWNSYVKATGFGPVGMNSFNHYAYGAVLAWMYGTMAGISEDPKAPGFKHIILAPIPDKRVGHVDASYNSAYGTIKGDLISTDYFSNFIRMISKKSGIEFRSYMLRHKFATDLQKTETPRTVQDLLGHASFQMSVEYARSTEEERQEAVKNRLS